MKVRRTLRRGFTLIELLLVMVILVILSAIVVPQVAKQGNRARITKTKTDLTMYESALAAFQIDVGRFPSNEEGLSVLLNNPGAPNWDGPYVKLIATDPWGAPYVYQAPGTHFPSSFDLYSRGPDQNEGSEDDIANWQS